MNCIITILEVMAGLVRKKRFKAIVTEYDPNEYYLFHDKRLIYISLAKNASSSIKMAIADHYGYDYIPRRIHGLKHWNKLRGTIPGKYNAYFKFAFVRNPFERLVSCYVDKFTVDKNYFINHPYGFKEPPTFAEYIEFVCCLPDRYADRHFKSQYAILFNSGKPDFIGKVESINDDWKVLSKKYGFSESLYKANVTSVNLNKKIDYKSYYTLELLDKVYLRFRKDVDELGYADEYHELKRYLTG